MRSQRAKHQEKGNGASFLEMSKLVEKPKTIEETQRVQTIRGCRHARKTNTPDSKPNKGTRTEGGQIDEGVCITCPKTERICKGFARLFEGSGGIPWFCCSSGRGCVLHGVRVCCIFCLFCFNSVHIRGIVRANGFTRGVCKIGDLLSLKIFCGNPIEQVLLRNQKLPENHQNGFFSALFLQCTSFAHC